MTLLEIDYLHKATDMHETRADLYSARIVAAIFGVNSKHARYDPVKYMFDARMIKEQQHAKRADREPMTGDAFGARLMQLQQIGFPVIDNRTHQHGN